MAKMNSKNPDWMARAALVVVSALAVTISVAQAQPPAGGAGSGRGPGGFGRGGGRGGAGMALFNALDTDKDGSIERPEMAAAFAAWYASWDTAKSDALSEDQLLKGLTVVFPSPPPGGFMTKGNSQPMTTSQANIDAMMAALPTTPGATPARPRKVLVFAHTGMFGFVHSSIPMAAKTVEALGNKGDLWSTTVSYDLADITAANLKQYDAIFLDSTTGEFLDDPNDKGATELRHRALLDFVKGGKGLAGIHAATDSYHKAGTETPAQPSAPQVGTWPEFNEMIGGYFKFHWTYPTLIPVKVDDPNSPLTSMFPARGFEMVDETYTFPQDSFSRKRVHVLTSINYAKMSAEDKAKEPAATRRTDGDYALSYIQRVGQGRVFYEAHGHDEKVYFQRPFILHMLAGIQYVIGDLQADDSPSSK